jgi:hypothetical protein
MGSCAKRKAEFQTDEHTNRNQEGIVVLAGMSELKTVETFRDQCAGILAILTVQMVCKGSFRNVSPARYTFDTGAACIVLLSNVTDQSIIPSKASITS